MHGKEIKTTEEDRAGADDSWSLSSMFECGLRKGAGSAEMMSGLLLTCNGTCSYFRCSGRGYLCVFGFELG